MREKRFQMEQPPDLNAVLPPPRGVSFDQYRVESGSEYHELIVIDDRMASVLVHYWCDRTVECTLRSGKCVICEATKGRHHKFEGYLTVRTKHDRKLYWFRVTEGLARHEPKLTDRNVSLRGARLMAKRLGEYRPKGKPSYRGPLIGAITHGAVPVKDIRQQPIDWEKFLPQMWESVGPPPATDHSPDEVPY